MTFFDIAKPMAERNVPQIRIRPISKAAFDSDWPSLATTDLNILRRWSEETPDAGSGSVAKATPGSFWFWEVDSGAALERLHAETGKQVDNAFMVRSRPGRGHFYFRHSAASLAMGNISQTYVKGADWSARCDNMYVISPGTIHPISQTPYEIIANRPITEAPDWLIEWLISQKVEKKHEVEETPRNERGLIPYGQGLYHGWLVQQAGKLRQIGVDIDTLETALVKLAQENLEPPIDLDKVRQVARSFKNYPPGQNTDLVLTQSVQVSPQIAQVENVELPTFEDIGYPKFPRYVMENTSIYDGFVRPVCEKNSRVDYFMWLIGEQLLLNYIGTKIKIKTGFGPRPFRGSIYSVLIGRKGKTNKSSSVGDAMAYFNYAGCLAHASRDIKNADGKTLTWTAGSPEGLGIDMQKTGCRNAVLFYDELSQLVSKAGIETSALTSSLLTMYEAGKFSNSTKSTKESFSLDPETYCTSIIACTTDKKFGELWSKLAGSDNGMDDRFFFILQPEPLPTPQVQTYINTGAGSIETKKRIDAAIIRGEIEIEDTENAHLKALVAVENRYANRAEKWAVALAVDMGTSVVDDEIWERACDIVKYEIAVKKYLRSYEATTREGQIQQDIRRHLEMARGRMLKRDLLRKINYDRFGTSLWNISYGGLVKNGIIREEGSGVRGEPTYVQLLVKREAEEE